MSRFRGKKRSLVFNTPSKNLDTVHVYKEQLLNISKNLNTYPISTVLIVVI